MGIRIGIGSLKIGQGSTGVDWSSYWKTQSLFFLDGTIITVGENKYFEDKSAADRHFLITGYDFATDWTTGFPYKSAATISAPADAALIAADINNFLYDAGGTPNQIPVVSLFQDIDYEHKIFCKHAAQVVDGNGVETYEPRVSHIFMATDVLSGDDLTKAYVDFGVAAEDTTDVNWITKAGLDAQAGTKAAPWLTQDKANASATAGNLIYSKTGIYDESSAALPGCLYMTKGLTYFGLGRNIMTSPGANYVLFISAAASYAFKNFVIDGENDKNTCANIYSVGNKTVAWERCMFTRGNTTIYNGQSVETVSFSACVFLGKSASATQTFAVFADQIINSILADCMVTSGRDLTFNNNKFLQNNKSICIRPNNTGVIAIGNVFNYSTGCIIEKEAYTSAKVVNIKYNTFNQGDLTGTAGRAIDIRGTADLDLSYNKFNSIAGDYAATAQMFVGILDVVGAELNNNICKSLSEKTFNHIIIQIGSVTIGACKLNNNYCESASLAGVHFGMLESTAHQLANGTEVKNNRIIGFKRDNPTGTTTGIHGVLLTAGINMDIRTNYISHHSVGLVVKTGDQDAYTANGVQYNIFKDCGTGIYVRGVDAMNIFNNTIIHTSAAYTNEFGNGIFCDENSTNPGCYSENIIIKNNIIISERNAGSLIRFDAHAFANGCLCDYNIYYSPVAKPFHDGTASRTFAEWQALGQDVHSIMLTSMAQVRALFNDYDNGDYSLKTGGAAIGAGDDLGTDYDDGLDASTTWGSTTTLPVVVTKQQGAAWDCGAYVS